MKLSPCVIHILATVCVILLCSARLHAFSVYLLQDEDAPKTQKRMSTSPTKFTHHPHPSENRHQPTALSDMLSSYITHLQGKKDSSTNQLYNWKATGQGSVMQETQNLACTKFDCSVKPCCNGICAYVFGTNLCLAYGKK